MGNEWWGETEPDREFVCQYCNETFVMDHNPKGTTPLYCSVEHKFEAWKMRRKAQGKSTKPSLFWRNNK